MPLPSPSPTIRNSLNIKAHWPRGSAEGRPRVNMAVLMGSQLPACWHAPRRLTTRIVMPPRDGERLLSTCVDNGERILYICRLTRAGMPTQRMVREAT